MTVIHGKDVFTDLDLQGGPKNENQPESPFQIKAKGCVSLLMCLTRTPTPTPAQRIIQRLRDLRMAGMDARGMDGRQGSCTDAFGRRCSV